MSPFKAFASAALTLVLSVTGVAVAPAASASIDDDVATVVDRLQEYYLGQGDEIILANGIYLARTSEALEYVETQNEDGSWSDVDYADRTSSANGSTWSAYTALYRMIALAQAYRDPDAAGFESPAVLDAVERALRYWDSADPGNQNWWETEIGESIAMGRVSIFLGDVLAEDAREVSLEHNTGRLDPVGANGAWRTTNYLFEAFATSDEDAIEAGFETMVQTITVDPSGDINEAVQPDASFWAHGPQLYSEGYGMVLFTSAALWADVARGTSLAFDRSQLDAIAFYIIEGTRWMIRGEIGMLYLNYREPKTVQGVTSHASEFIEPLQRMARTDALYSTAYQGILDGVLGETRTNGVTGDRYFWRSEFSSHLRDEYGIFTRLNSSRTIGTELRTAYRDEIGNPVYWNSMGATAIQVTNREYLDLGPTFDWRHYPGVTAPDEKRTERGPSNRISNGDGAGFTGGVSDGRYGLNVLTLDSAGTTGQKSYFAFDDEFVALGTGIASTSDAPVHTTINQVAAKPNASVGGESVASGTDGVDVGDARWAYNDEVGYVFDADADVRVSNKTQRGSWIDQDEVARDAFSLYVDHGVAPQSASYAYTVLPAATPAEVAAYAAAPRVETLRNDADVQAVRHAGLDLTMAVFASAGSLDLGDGRALSVDQPSLVLLDESGKKPVVSVSQPERPGAAIAVSLTGGPRDWSARVTVGSGADLGRTVTAEMAAGDLEPRVSASASSTAGGTSAAALTDGDADSVWRSRGDELEWVATRLDRGSWVTKVSIDWAEGFATDYIVQTSTDGENWTDETRVTYGDGGTDEVAIDPTPAEFVRIVLLGTDAKQFGIGELSVDSSVNLALDASGRASGYTGYNMAYLFRDGDPETRWSGPNNNGTWAQVDLGETRPVSTVRLRWEAAYAKTYKIQLSDDGRTWRDAYTTPSGGSDGGLDVIRLDDQEARFVRMQTLTRALNYGPSLWEFEVFGDRLVADAPAVPAASANLALGRTATADSVHNNLANIQPSKAVDGNTGTKWSSARSVAEHWLRVDLGRVTSISQAVVKWEAGRSDDYRFEGSVDGETWETLARVESAQSSLTHTHDFAPTDVRYVRVAGIPATQYGLNIWELEVYGGFTFDCVEPVVATAKGSATASVQVSPVVAGDVYAARSLDEDVVTVDGETAVTDDGRVDVPLRTGDPGRTAVLVTHDEGEEYAWCDVAVSADVTALDALVDRANGLDSTRYTADSWSPVLPALRIAKDTLAQARSTDEVATDAEVDEAERALDRALKGLREIAPPDKKRPEVALVTPTKTGPFRQLEVSVDASDEGGLSKIVANIYGEDGTLVKSTQTKVTDGATTATHEATVTLPDGAYTIKYNAHDLAGNVSKTGTQPVTIDTVAPTATIKTGDRFTQVTGETYDLISFKLHDAGKIDRVTVNGKVKDLTDNVWSDVNFLTPPTFGAVKGENTLVVYDVAGNSRTYTFVLN